MPELPTGTVTFLFTDLEGSTRLWEEHPAAMQPALARHDEILRDAIAAYSGHVVKMTGDGVHAAFGTAQAAIDAAVVAQQALADEQWSEVGSLRVRMGLHTGAAEIRDGDYYGTAVNKAARLMSAAHGGQTVVSHATEEVARDTLGIGLDLVDLGEHRLRDLARAERVFQLRAPGLADDFPPLQSLDAFPGNLPTLLTSFVGRDEDVVEVAKALAEARLVTMTGVGGVGKTRLAVQVAAEVLPDFPDGAWLCELAAATDDEALAQVVAATLGVPPRAGTSLEGSVVDFLHGKDALLVLDNCEHLLDAAAELAESILAECPGVRILATSREGLAVAGEQVWPLRSLSLPRRSTTEEALSSPAVQLFADRARAAAPRFILDAANADAAVEICRRLDGIPLAIELAAARVGAMSTSEIAGLLDERFRLLTGGRRTSVERHQTLRATVDWSYSMLDGQERLVFDRLGVFAGSFDATAAAQVASGDGIESWDARDALTRLVGRSMIVAEQTPDDTTRYAMLETLRQYARERLDESGAADQWRRQHAQHYSVVATECGRELVGAEELVVRERIHDELDNLRAAFNWALDRDDPDDLALAVTIVANLALQATCDVASGIGMWAERAVPRLGGSPAPYRHAVLGAAAYTSVQCRGDMEGGSALAREALSEPLPPDSPGLNLAHVALAMSCAYTRDWAGCTQALDDGFAALDAVDANAFYRSSFYSSAANLHNSQGELERARAEAEVSLRLARDARNPTCLALALFGVAWNEWALRPEVALAAVEESIALTRSGAVDGAMGSALTLLSRIRAEQGDPAGALAALREALSYAHEVGDLGNLTFVLAEAITVFGRHRHLELAADVVGALTGEALRGMVWSAVGIEGDRRDEAIAAVRAKLGEDAFTRASERGADLTIDEVYALVLVAIDELLAEVGHD